MWASIVATNIDTCYATTFIPLSFVLSNQDALYSLLILQKWIASRHFSHPPWHSLPQSGHIIVTNNKVVVTKLHQSFKHPFPSYEESGLSI